MAVVFVLVAHLIDFLPASQTKLWLFQNLSNGIQLSLVLAIFNLLPILPLDGGRIVSSLLPLKYSIEYQKTENYGFFILIGLMFIGPMLGIDIIGWFINTLYPLFLGFISIFI